jgi:hypothetical protein
MDVQIVKQNSVDRLESIMRRFDRQDRLTGMVVSGIFAIALATGGIYLESYLTQQHAVNKHLSSLDHNTPVVVGSDDDDDDLSL